MKENKKKSFLLYIFKVFEALKAKKLDLQMYLL